MSLETFFLDRRTPARLAALGWITAGLMVCLSAISAAFPDQVYRTGELADAFQPNDLVNLVLGLPLFLLALIGMRRGKLSACLLLPGALIYTFYNYLAYLLGQPWSWLSTLYLILVALPLIGLAAFLGGLDLPCILARLGGRVADRFSGWVLVLFGLAFSGLAVSQLWSGVRSGAIPPLGENAVAVADIFLSLGLAAGGVLLLRRRPAGYAVGLGLLAAASSLFLGLVLFFFLAPPLVGRPLDWGEIVSVLVMGLFAFVPTALFWSGASREQTDSRAGQVGFDH